MFAKVILRPFACVLDVLFSLLVVAPLVVIFWYTTWTIWNNFIFPEDQVKSAATSFAIGFLGQFLMIFYQESLAKVLTFKKHFAKVIVTKVNALVIALTSISLWRGSWLFADLTSSDSNFSIILNVFQNAMILILSKSLRNSIAALFVVTFDQNENVFQTPTYFKRVKADGAFRFAGDCIFTCFLMALTVVVWRDIWTLIHYNLLPEDEFLSACLSLVIGAVMAVTIFAVEDFIRKMSKMFLDFQILFHDVLILLCIVATVFVWRGLWTLLEIYFGHRLNIIFLLNFVAWLLLVILNCSSSLTGKGILIDCEEGDFELPYKYFKLLFRKNEMDSTGKVNEAFSEGSTQM